MPCPPSYRPLCKPDVCGYCPQALHAFVRIFAPSVLGLPWPITARVGGSLLCPPTRPAPKAFQEGRDYPVALLMPQ